MLKERGQSRLWLARRPLSILLAGRIRVGATFFKARSLKYNSWEFTVKLFQDEYRVARLRMPAATAATAPMTPRTAITTAWATALTLLSCATRCGELQRALAASPALHHMKQRRRDNRYVKR
jgi:hypothetical protein